MGTTYPRKVADGRGMVWACCESSIGRPCAHQGSARGQALRVAAREDVRAGLAGERRDLCATHGVHGCACTGDLAAVLPGDGTEGASAEDVACVSRILGFDVRMIPDQWGRTGSGRRVNVALLRSQLRRWAVRESCGLRPTDGAA